MNIELYLFCFFAGILGIIGHVLFIKIPQLKSSAKVANAPFSVKGYLEDDWLALATSIFTVIVAMFVIDEIIKWQPIVQDWIKWFFIFIGYTGSSIFQSALSKTSDKINSIIDIKTNIADGK